MSLADKLLCVEALLLVALTFGLLLWLGRVRVPLIVTRAVRMRDIALSRDGWPERARQLGNAVDNQFQLPVLFYVAVLLTLWRGGAGWLEVAIGAAFVVTRFAHAAIHTTDNHVQRRFFAYTAGLSILSVYWLVLAARIVSA